MRIGIDATCWTNWRGFGRFTRSIIGALLAIDRTNEYVLFFDSTYERCEGVPSNARHVVVRTSAAQTEAISVDGRRSAGDLLRMTLSAVREGLDVFFCPSIDSYFPIVGRAARVVMIHDTIPETLPQTMLPGTAARVRRSIKVRAAIGQAHVVATGSERIRNQVEAVFGVAPQRLAVIPYGVSDRFRPPASLAAVRQYVAERHAVRTPYLLHVGGFGPNKNIPALLKGFAALSSESGGGEASLVFVGKRDDDAVYDEAHEIDRLLRLPELKHRVVLLGFQVDEELVPLYQAARALVLPSLVEGFGLPALEAVSCGTPAVATAESPLPEVLGDAAVAIDPLDDAGLVRAMRRALDDDELTRHALAWAGRLTWETSARAALGVFQRAMSLRVH